MPLALANMHASVLGVQKCKKWCGVLSAGCKNSWLVNEPFTIFLSMPLTLASGIGNFRTHSKSIYKSASQCYINCVEVPRWRNWQTRWLEGPVGLKDPCGFKSRPRHHFVLGNFRPHLSAFFPCQSPHQTFSQKASAYLQWLSYQWRPLSSTAAFCCLGLDCESSLHRQCPERSDVPTNASDETT